MSTVKNNIQDIQAKIKKAAESSGRKAEEVNLVAVSKRQPDERIQAALDAGQRIFGENRVQEAYDHWADRKTYAGLKIHLIGPLQTNKVKEAVALFDCIETVDRPKLARALANEMSEQDRVLPCFIQVNTGEEAQKSGVHPDDLPDFLDYCRRHCGLIIAGLMCIPPVDEPAVLHFALLKKLADIHGLKELSMGMSADFEKAIPLGATYVRVGSALFGERV